MSSVLPRTTNLFSKKYQNIMHAMSIQGKYSLIGSSAIRNILYGADIDLMSELIKYKNSPHVLVHILHIFQEKFRHELRRDSVCWITDFKCGEKYGEPLRWNKDTIAAGWQTVKGKRENFIDHILDKSIIKLDYVTYDSGFFIEFSENYYFKIGNEYSFDRRDMETQNLAKSISESGEEYLEEGNYFKALKREYAVIRLLDKREPLQKLLLSFFNSQAGIIYKSKSDCETIILMLQQTFRPVPMEEIRNAIQHIKQVLGLVTEVKFNMDMVAKNLDRTYTLKSKDKISEILLQTSNYLLKIISRVAEEFIKKHKIFKKI